MADVYFNNFWAMGTRCDVVLPDIKTSTADFLCRKIHDEIIRVENKLSHFMPVSDVSYINENASQKEIYIDDELFDLLKQCVNFSQKTEGCFDISILPILELWQRYQQNNRQTKPKQQEIGFVLEKTGYQHVLLNEQTSGIAFDQSGVKIDLCGIGKGYALDKVKEILLWNEVQNAVVSFGESSILAMGHHPYGDSWRIGIQHIYSPGMSVHTFELNNKSLSTSGVRPEKDVNKRMNGFHIINPHTGNLIQDQKAFSVTSESATEAEVLSTALVASADEHKKRILNYFPRCQAIEMTYQQDDTVDLSILQ